MLHRFLLFPSLSISFVDILVVSFTAFVLIPVNEVFPGGLMISVHGRKASISYRRNFIRRAGLSPPSNLFCDNNHHDRQELPEMVRSSNASESYEHEEEKCMDFDALENEAKDVVKEYRSSLSYGIRQNNKKKKYAKKKFRSRKTTLGPASFSSLPKVAIVGRPNVGKSALFNHLVGSNEAIVLDTPGVTRDRMYGTCCWGDIDFMVVDTGGVVDFSNSDPSHKNLTISTPVGYDVIPFYVMEDAVSNMSSLVEKQVIAAIQESKVVIFLVDGKAGVTAADSEISKWLRKNHTDKCIILAVNKCESPVRGSLQAHEFWSLGFTPIPISALKGTGVDGLLNLVFSEISKPLESTSIIDDDKKELEDIHEEESDVVALAIIGRPNVGKSSILNALIKEDRAIVSPVSGTTRDAVDVEFATSSGQKYRLIDTAGIRRKASVGLTGCMLESQSVNRALRAIRRADIVALVIEAMTCVTEQDKKLAERIEKEGKGCLIVINKWDTIPKKNKKTVTLYEEDVREKLLSLSWAPIVYSTAVSGNSVENIIVAAEGVNNERSRRLHTSILNQVLCESLAIKPPPTQNKRKGRLYYATQAAVRPPTFVLFVNDTSLFPDVYRRFIERKIRANAGFDGTPIRVLWRRSGNTVREGATVGRREGSS